MFRWLQRQKFLKVSWIIHFEVIFGHFFSNLPYKRVKFAALTRLIEGWSFKSRNGTPTYKNQGRAPPPPGGNPISNLRVEVSNFSILSYKLLTSYIYHFCRITLQRIRYRIPSPKKETPRWFNLNYQKLERNFFGQCSSLLPIGSRDKHETYCLSVLLPIISKFANEQARSVVFFFAKGMSDNFCAFITFIM